MRHRRRTKFQAGGGVNLAVMVTPMLDMAFQLLAFFIMTSRPPPMENADEYIRKEGKEGYIQGELAPPSVDRPKPKPPDKDKKLVDPTLSAPPPIDEEPPLSDPLTDSILVIVRTLSKDDEAREPPLLNGEPRSVEIRLPETTINVDGDRSVFTDAKKKREEQVAAYARSLAQGVDRELKAILKKPGNALTDVRLEADPGLRLRYWMAIYDVCKLAGAKNVSFVPPAKSK